MRPVYRGGVGPPQSKAVRGERHRGTDGWVVLLGGKPAVQSCLHAALRLWASHRAPWLLSFSTWKMGQQSQLCRIPTYTHPLTHSLLHQSVI